MLEIVESADEMEVAHIHGLVGVLIGLEGGHTLGASLAVLRSMYSLGTRFISLTGLECTTPWAAAVNNIDLVYDETQPISLTTFGESVLHEMNRLGILVEISRLSEPAMMTALHAAKAPVLFSNTAPLVLCNSSNSLPDHILGCVKHNLI